MLVPFTILFFLFISGAFANNFSSNDPFRTFSLQASRYPKFPICCLKPLSPQDSVEDNFLLSFEEWKAQQQEQRESKEQHKSKEHVTGHAHNANANNSGQELVGLTNDSQSKNAEHLTAAQNSTSQPSSQQLALEYDITSKSRQPHFRVPTTDRFNYASIDCSARVHTAHRSAKSPSAVLDSKRDRYMLSPCKRTNGEKQFIAIELCDDIRIDTVQLANFEFFSGVFKDFSVRVAKTYTTDEEGWVDAGTYRAKNVRGVQSFHPPTSLHDFYRFIRIEFQSFYGNEYYCPVSLLRVYGLSHLEEYKWEQWMEESKARLESQSSMAEKEEPHSTTAVSSLKEATTDVILLPFTTRDSSSNDVSTSSSIESATQIEASSATGTGQNEIIQSAPPNNMDIASNASQSALIKNTDASSLSTDYPDSLDTPVTYSHSMAHSSEVPSIVTPLQQPASSSPSSPAPSPPPSSYLSNPSSSYTVSGAVVVSTLSAHIPQATIPSASGESIYRTIMNRLSALEINHTLYARYVEQQNTAIRDVLKRLSEDVGRLEGIGRAHTQVHQRTVQEWERQRQKLQMDYNELLAVVEYLSDEIVLEKRLGVAQLCLLLLVLVFIALTRGSRGEPIIKHDMSTRTSTYPSLRELGKHLSLSTDWFRSVSSTDDDAIVDSNDPPTSSRLAHDASALGKFKYPQQKQPLSAVNLNIAASPTASLARRHSDLRTRRGSDRKSIKRNIPHPLHLSPTTHMRSMTPSKSGARHIPLRRSSSHNSELHKTDALGSARSARKSAKSAHLHEFIPPSIQRDGAQESSIEDVFSSPLSHRSPPTSSGVGLGSADHLRDGTVVEQLDVLWHPAGAIPEGDQSVWEDTDSVGELDILDS